MVHRNSSLLPWDSSTHTHTYNIDVHSTGGHMGDGDGGEDEGGGELANFELNYFTFFFLF